MDPLISTFQIWCGCTARVTRDPITGLTHSRTLATRELSCRQEQHTTGANLWLTDLLPPRSVGQNHGLPRIDLPGNLGEH